MSYSAREREAPEFSKRYFSARQAGALTILAGWATLLLLGTGVAAAQNGEDLEALSRDPAQWVMAPKNYANTRFSELEQINPANVDGLQLAWSFSVGVNRGQEAAPLVVGNKMYVVRPHPNNLLALDATTGDLKRMYSPPTATAAIGVACCDVVNRGAAYSNGKIFFNTLDNHTVAVDAKTGKEVWHTKLGEINRGETMTMAPLVVVKGKVLVGNSGGEMGVRGWLTALDENTGEIVWRVYSTGPDEDVLLGDNFAPRYDWMKGADLGVKTWPPDHWRQGGGTVWGWITGNPDPGTANSVPATTSGRRRSSPAIRTPAWRSGPTRPRPTTSGIPMASTSSSCSTSSSTARCARSGSVRAAPVTCT
jgi:PQQ-dependent dehydrogenase (methanol/ethanol family)